MVERNTSSIGYRMQNHYEIILNAGTKLEHFKISGVDQATTTNVTSMGGGLRGNLLINKNMTRKLGGKNKARMGQPVFGILNFSLHI